MTLSQYSVSATDNYVKCPCNNFIKRHFNQYFVNNNNNNTLFQNIASAIVSELS